MRYVIALGANLGQADAVVASALERLAGQIDGRLVAASSLYRTAPVGGPEQPDFCNAVAIVDSPWEPVQVLEALQSMESQAGRTAGVRWGPRTLDLDIIDAGQGVSDDPHVTLPHPRAHERAFVLIPWLEIDPQAELPGHGTVRDLVAAGFPGQQIQRVGSS